MHNLNCSGSLTHQAGASKSWYAEGHLPADAGVGAEDDASAAAPAGSLSRREVPWQRNGAPGSQTWSADAACEAQRWSG